MEYNKESTGKAILKRWRNHGRPNSLFSSYFAHAPLSQVVDAKKVISHIPTNCNSIYLKPVSVKEIKDIIPSIKSKTSLGIDGIPTSAIRPCVDRISIPLCFLVNQSFDEKCISKTIIQKWRSKQSKKLWTDFYSKWIFKNL